MFVKRTILVLSYMYTEPASILMEAMEPVLSTAFLGVKRFEHEHQKDWSLEAEVDWLLTAF